MQADERTSKAEKVAHDYMIELLSNDTLNTDNLRKGTLSLYRTGDIEDGTFYLIGYLGFSAELRRRLIAAGLWIES